MTKNHGLHKFMMKKVEIMMKVFGLFLCLSAAQLLSAQQIYYSTLVGTVKDPTGAVVPGAKVVATRVASGVSSSTLTNSGGDYRIANLHPGSYDVVVTMAGFKEEVVHGITLMVGTTSRVDVPLEMGRTGQAVTVTGTVPLVQTESAERGGVLTGREIEALPLQSRQVTELAFLQPGAVRSTTYFGIVQSHLQRQQFHRDSQLPRGRWHAHEHVHVLAGGKSHHRQRSGVQGRDLQRFCGSRCNVRRDRFHRHQKRKQ